MSLWNWRRCINTFQKQITSFFFIGIFSFSIDAGVYFFLLSYFGSGIVLSKTISFMLGTLNSYIFNRTITFKSKIAHEIGASRHYLVYGTSLFCNVNLNYFTYNFLIDDFSNAHQIAFMFATVVSVLINFFGLKFFVFRK